MLLREEGETQRLDRQFWREQIVSWVLKSWALLLAGDERGGQAAWDSARCYSEKAFYQLGNHRPRL